MKIQKVTDPAFRRYGKVLEGYNFGPLLKEMKHTPVPEDVVYVPSAEELEALDVETLTPIEALNFLYELKKTLKGSLNR